MTPTRRILERVEEIEKDYNFDPSSRFLWLTEAVKELSQALEKIDKNRIMTVMNESQEFMDGAHEGYLRQADIASTALAKVAGDGK